MTPSTVGGQISTVGGKYPKSDMQLDRVVSIFSSLVANQEVLSLFFYLQSIVVKTAHYNLWHAASTRGQSVLHDLPFV